MGLFTNKPKRCGMCQKTALEGCGDTRLHVEEIREDSPEWLAPGLRATGQGNYTWLCVHCDSYSDVKWPSVRKACEGIGSHLAAAHELGKETDVMAMKIVGGPGFDMIKAEPRS